MLTNNFYYAISDELCSTLNLISNMKSTLGNEATAPSGTSTYYQVYPFGHGGTYSLSPTLSQDASNPSVTGGFAAGLLIGSGDTAPTADDYRLENQITTGFSATASFPNNATDISQSRRVVATATITNTSDADIVVREIGYVRAATSKWVILYDRIVLDSPVTIAPGATKTFEYHLNMPTP